MKKIILLFNTILFLISCSSTPTNNTSIEPVWRPDIAIADFGTYPLYSAEIILTWVEQNLATPEMIYHLAFSEPRAEYIVTNPDKQQAIFGYAVCVEVTNVEAALNDKPPMYWFLLHNDQIIQHR